MFGVVVTDVGWQVARHGAVMAHEGAHAVADSLLGRQVDYIKLNFSAEQTGVTKAKNVGGWSARVIAAFAGYIGPSSFGLGAAKLIQLGYATAVVWVTLFLLGILLLLLRWSFGVLTVTLAGGFVYAVGRYMPASARSSPPTRSPGSSCCPEVAASSSGARNQATEEISASSPSFRASSGFCSGWRLHSRRSRSAADGWSCEPEARSAVRPALIDVTSLSLATVDVPGKARLPTQQAAAITTLTAA